MRKLVQRVLEMSGFSPEDCFCASNGIEALEVLGSRAVDLILSDINMPRMDGEELMRALKADENLREIPVLILSTDATHRRMRDMFALEPGEPMPDVSRIADLALLAIARDIDAHLDLFPDHIFHRALHNRFELGGVHRLPAILREDQIHHILRSRQAADMGGENAVRTQLHLLAVSLGFGVAFQRRIATFEDIMLRRGSRIRIVR